MQGINPEKIPEFVQRDVDNVVRNAMLILKISPNEKQIEIIENQNPFLGVIAVVGPAWNFGRNFKEAVLTEIGVSASRPYHRASGLGNKSGETYVNKRRKWFSLFPNQYQLVAPIIFKRIEGIAFQKVSTWKKGPLSDEKFLLPSTWHRWLRKRRILVAKSSLMESIRGIRFSVSLKDEFFVRDIYWAELNLNKHLANYITGLTNFVDLRLNWYKYRYRGRKTFGKLKGAIQVEERLKQCFLSRYPHLLFEVARRLKEEKRSNFWPHVAEMIKWNGRETEERKLASLACSQPDLPHPKSRLGNIQLQVTTSLNKKKDYIVFEVFPRKK